MKTMATAKQRKQVITQKNGMIFKSVLTKRLASIEKIIQKDIENNPIVIECEDIPKECNYTIFISVSDGTDRARVCHASDENFAAAFMKTRAKAEAIVERHSFNPLWIKVDVVDHIEKDQYSSLKKRILKLEFQKFFRMGFSLDPNMDMAFTEAEANSYKLYDYTVIPMKASKPGHDKVPCIDKAQVAQYLKWNDINQEPSLSKILYFFNCRSFFMDEKQDIFRLYGEGLNCGRRITEELSPEFVKGIITTASQYLTRQILPDNKFIYGYYPSFNLVMEKYNILRHAGTLWSMMCAHDVTGDAQLLDTIKRSLSYMMTQIKLKDENTAFLVEEKSHEIKLGGNGIAIITLSKYMEKFDDADYTDMIQKLANGILHLQDTTSGKFLHVINSVSFRIMEEFRTVYYDGEASYALIKAYEVTGDKKYLLAAQKAIDYFIQNDYVKYRDHWLAYAMNAFTKHVQEDKYYTFALRNAWENRVRIRNQATSYHTYLELMMETYDLYLRMKREHRFVELMGDIDEEEFEEIIKHRAWHMLDGYFYPEYAMYMSKPQTILGSFFVRHDGFRTRIDDDQHFIDGYSKFYKLFLADDHEKYKKVEKVEGMMDVADIISAVATNDEEFEQLSAMLKGKLEIIPSCITDNPSALKKGGVFIWAHLAKEAKGSVSIVRDKKPILVISEEQIADLPCFICEAPHRAWLRICNRKLKLYKDLKKIVVTGSVGKTTVKDIIYSVINEAGPSIKNHESVNGWRGITLAVTAAPSNLQYYVTEMGLNQPNNAFVSLSEAIEPDICVLTNIGDAHFENFKSKEQILEQKYLCAHAMSEETGTLIINYDDPIIMAGEYRHKTITVSMTDPKADYHAEDIEVSDGLSFVAVSKGRRMPVHMEIMGEHNIFNALVAIAVGDKLGIDEKLILKGLEGYQTSGMRQNIVDETSVNGTKQKLLIDCYNASSASMRSSMTMLRDIKIPEGAKRIAVLGDMVSAGKLTEEAHTDVGKYAIEMNLDVVIGFGEHTAYATDYIRNNSDIQTEQFTDAAECAKYLKTIIGEGDSILFKGSRAMKMEDIITKVYRIHLQH